LVLYAVSNAEGVETASVQGEKQEQKLAGKAKTCSKSSTVSDQVSEL
jgi:hypothetical protein